jgi:hypothetical protein
MLTKEMSYILGSMTRINMEKATKAGLSKRYMENMVENPKKFVAFFANSPGSYSKGVGE